MSIRTYTHRYKNELNNDSFLIIYGLIAWRLNHDGSLWGQFGDNSALVDAFCTSIASTESNYGDDFEDIGPVPFEPIGAESPTLMVADLDPVLHDTQRTVDDDDAAEGDEDHRWTKRTQNVLNSIAGKLRSSGEEQISMTDLLTKGSTRKTAAQKFYTLLVLKKWQAIDVEQKSPYDDILISAGPNITQTVAYLIVFIIVIILMFTYFLCLDGSMTDSFYNNICGQQFSRVLVNFVPIGVARPVITAAGLFNLRRATMHRSTNTLII
uniref:Rad21_Rec8 domain-containing protein n=1 Tax=Heterorhabditis bacteriophora TaxID=37862 RepID=A0A1I7WSU9_HETBA